MAITSAQQTSAVGGADKKVVWQITGDTSYPTGGYALTPATFNLNLIRSIHAPCAVTVAGAKWIPVIIPTYSSNQLTNVIQSAKLALVVASTGLEVANAVDVSTSVVQLIVEGD